MESRWQPAPGERPTAYIVIVADGPLEAFLGCDVGAAAENIALTAFDAGVGTCILGSVKRDVVKNVLFVPDALHVVLTVALGFPAEQSVAEKFEGSVKYWRDENDVHRVPKKSLGSIRHIETFHSEHGS